MNVTICHLAKYDSSHKNGIDVVLYNLTKNQTCNYLGNNITSEICNISKCNVNVAFLRLLFDMLNVGIYLWTIRPNLVVFHCVYNPVTWGAYFLLRFLKLKYVVMPHSSLTVTSQQKSKLKKYWARIIVVNKLIKNAEYVSYLNENEFNNSLKLNDKHRVVGNGVDFDSGFKSTSREKYISFLARYDVHHKGIDVLLNAVKIAKEDFISLGFKLVMHGVKHSDSDNKFIIDFIQDNDLNDIVLMKGELTSVDEKFNFIAHSHAFVLTSRYEGVPISILESLSYLTPVLVTPGTNMGDVVLAYKLGFVCDFDSLLIASELIKVMQCNPLSFSNSIKEYVSGNLDWHKLALLHLKYYLEVL